MLKYGGRVVEDIFLYARRIVAGTFLIAVASAIVVVSINLVPALQLRLSSGHVDQYPEALDIVLTRHKLEQEKLRIKEDYKRLDLNYGQYLKELVELQQQRNLVLKVTPLLVADNYVTNGSNVAQNTLDEGQIAELQKLEQDLSSRMITLSREADNNADEINIANERLNEFVNSANENKIILSKLESMLPTITHPIVGAPFLVPCEILVLILAVLMGALGGVICVAKGFITPGTPNPEPCSYFIRPIFGMAIAFVVFLFFKAGQLVISADGVDNPLNPFLIALLGVVSGMMAKDAITRIEIWGSRAFGTDDAPSQTPQDTTTKAVPQGAG